jgi:hypothetical protein
VARHTAGTHCKPASHAVLYRRALAGREEALGPAHPDTLTLVNNLAVLLKSLGKYDEAEPLYWRALAGKEEALGPAHPSTLTSVGNLARLLGSQGRYDEAEPLMRRDLAGCEKALGPAHPDTLKSSGNLAELLKSQRASRNSYSCMSSEEVVLKHVVVPSARGAVNNRKWSQTRASLTPLEKSWLQSGSVISGGRVGSGGRPSEGSKTTCMPFDI